MKQIIYGIVMVAIMAALWQIMIAVTGDGIGAPTLQPGNGGLLSPNNANGVDLSPLSVSVSGTSSSTVTIGTQSTTGCIKVGDSDGGGFTYIYTLDGAIMSASTSPAFCK